MKLGEHVVPGAIFGVSYLPKSRQSYCFNEYFQSGSQKNHFIDVIDAPDIDTQIYECVQDESYM